MSPDPTFYLQQPLVQKLIETPDGEMHSICVALLSSSAKKQRKVEKSGEVTLFFLC